MKRCELAGKGKQVFAVILSAAVMMTSIAPGAVYAEEVIIEEEPGAGGEQVSDGGAEPGMIEAYGAEDGMGATAGYDDVNGAGSGVPDSMVPSGETGSTSGTAIKEGAGDSDGSVDEGDENGQNSDSANADGLVMQSIDGFVMAIEEVEEPNGLATSILQSRIDALPTPEEFFAMTEEMAEESTLTQQQMDIYTEAQAIADEYEALSVEEQAQVDISRLETLMDAVNEMVAVTAEEDHVIDFTKQGCYEITKAGTYMVKGVREEEDDNAGTDYAIKITGDISGEIVLNIEGDISLSRNTALIYIESGKKCHVTINGGTKGKNNYKISNTEEYANLQIMPWFNKETREYESAEVTLAGGNYILREKSGGININNYGILSMNDVNIEGGYLGIGNSGFNDFAGNLTINNTTIKKAKSKGISNGTNITINSVTIEDCGSNEFFDGGIDNGYSGEITIHSALIRNNRGSHGAGIYNAGTLRLEQDSNYGDAITITQNVATKGCGGIMNAEKPDDPSDSENNPYTGRIFMKGKIEIFGNRAEVAPDLAVASEPIVIEGSLEGSNVNVTKIIGTTFSEVVETQGCLTAGYQKSGSTALDTYFHLKTKQPNFAQAWYPDGSSEQKEIGVLSHKYSWAYANDKITDTGVQTYLYCTETSSACAYYRAADDLRETDLTLTLTLEGDKNNNNKIVYSGQSYAGTVVTDNISAVTGGGKPEIYYTGTDYAGNQYASTTAPTDAGEYKVAVTINKGKEGLEKTIEKTFTIEPKELNVTWSNTALTYNATAQKPTAAATGLLGNDTCEVTITGEQKDAGTYTATATGLSNPNYKLPANATTAFTIAPKELMVTWGDTSFTYNGAAQKPTATLGGVVDGDVCNVTVTGEQTSAGTGYEATASIDNANYKIKSGNEMTTFEIKRASAIASDTKITNADKLSKEYDGTGIAAVESSSRNSSTPHIEYKKKAEPDSTYTATSPKDAGDYVVRVTYLQDTNYEESSATAEFTIAPKSLTDAMVGFDFTEKTYAGTKFMPTVTVSDQDENQQERITVADYEISGQRSASDAGTYTITVNGKGNYTGTIQKEWKINLKELTVTWSDTVLTYTGAEQKPTATLGGVVDGDVCNVTVSGEQKDAGTYTAIAASLSNSNYRIPASATIEFTITPKAVTVTANDAKKDSGKADPQLTYRADGLAASDTLNGISIRRQAGEAVGTYAITVSQSAGANPNYAITFRGATFTIEPADQSSLSGKAIYNLKLPMFLAKGSGSNKKITLSWLKYKGADGYEVYWSYCDGTQGFKKLGTFKKSTLSATHKKLNNKKEYKYYVAAYKMVNGKKIYIARSNALHVAMKNAKKTNAKSITVNKEKVTIREGKTFKLKCKVKTASGRKKQLLHTDKFRYHTSDSSIATVSKSGKIKAHKKGTCTIYIFANNGVYKSVKVTVKK